MNAAARSGLAIAAACVLAAAGIANVAEGPVAALRPLQPLVDATPAGGELRIPPGSWAGPVVLRRPITLDGGGAATISGEGRGTVLRIETAGARVRGITITGSGSNHDDVDAGIAIAGTGNVVEHVSIEDCLFGIDLAQANDNVVRESRIHSKSRSTALRGDAIRLWYSFRNSITDNEISDTRDVVVWYSADNLIARNRIERGRYALHTMYAHHNRVEDNDLRHNMTGVFLMYSDGVELRRNRILGAQGATGVGIGFKESSAIVLEDNDIVYCATGVLLDVSPYEPDTTIRFARNRFAWNGVGVLFHNDWYGNEFVDNVFLGNFTQVAVRGGGAALRNRWSGNHWDDYQGFDRDRDGTGDTPYELRSYADRIWMESPPAAFFRASPLLEVIDFLDRLAPFSSPTVILRDDAPRFDAPRFEARAPRAAGDRS
ncbi:MAG: nitrous oxide reductase family maturation protein NosD [Proteobacteria bacterium]|nr:MAG: nitrous oxide reductase family maturation protein NosD [Pseudomonadota bacterium]